MDDPKLLLASLNDNAQVPIRSFRDLEIGRRYKVLSFQKRLNSFGERVSVLLKSIVEDERIEEPEIFAYYLARQFSIPSKLEALEKLLIRPGTSVLLYISEIKHERNLIIPMVKFDIVVNASPSALSIDE